MSEPTFLYISKCCSVKANKPPCVRIRQQKGKRGESKVQSASLGHWSCGGCGKACSVTRQNNPALKSKGDN